MTDAELAGFVRTFRVFVRRALETAHEGVRSDLVVRLEEHLGVDPVGLPVVTDWHQPFEQANLHLALSAYGSSGGRACELVGGGVRGGRGHRGRDRLVLRGAGPPGDAAGGGGG
jgi:hypothetical protein